MDKTYITDEFALQSWAFDTNLEKVAFDFETTSLDYSVMKPLGLSLYNGVRACYIDLDVPEQAKMIEFLQYLFSKVIKKLIAHNIQFDMQVLHKIGIREHTENIFCTQVAAHLIDERWPTGLKDLALSILRIPPGDIKKWGEITKDHHSQEFYEYGINDSIWCWSLMERFYTSMQREKLHHLFFNTEMPFQFCLRDLHIHGIELDEDALYAIGDKVDPIRIENENKMLEMCGKEAQCQDGFWEDYATRESPVNFNSNPQVIPILREKFGIEFTELTDSGKKLVRDKKPVGHDYYKLDKVILGGSALDKGEIGGLAAKYPFCDHLLKYRMAKDLGDKFVVPVGKSVSPDGRVRTSFNDCVAVTGRLSSSDPNLQNLRKMNKVLGIECRSAFVAPKGKSFIVGDYKGQELRVLAQVTQDPTLLDAFRKGLDLHLVTANLLFNLGLNDKQLTDGTPEHKAATKEHKNDRYRAKNGFNFPVVYGSTAIGIARNIGISVPEAEQLLEKFLSTYPGVREAINRCTKLIECQGWVRNLAGRKRRFSGISKRAIRQGFNHLIQSYSADMLRLGMINIRQVILDHPEWEMLMVLTIHDEVVLEVKDEYIDVAKEAVEYAMVHAVELDVPVEVDTGVGRTYTQAK